MRLRWMVVACVLLGGCTQSNSVVCGNLICSEAAVCSPSGDACVLPTQLDACKGKVDDDPCTFPGVTMGACVSGVCTEVICGNGHTDAITGEICDDGNRISGDGCSADCKSREMCGDGIVDLFQGEECDCGISKPLAEGCTRPNSELGGAECRSDCKRARCGDHVKDPGEACDDGNNVPGDGCRADCQGRWTLMPTATFVGLEAVFAVSANEAYAVGDSAHFLRWSGTNWVNIPGPPTTDALIDVWAMNSSYILVLQQSGPKIWHFDLNNWEQVDPRSNPSANIIWTAISGTNFNDVWLVGYENNDGRFAHYNGNNWTSFGAASLTNAALIDVYATPGGPVYATDSSSRVYTLTTSGAFATQVVDGNAQGNLLAGTSPTHVVVYGAVPNPSATNAPGGKIFNGSTWSFMTSSAELPGVTGLAAASDGTTVQQIAVGGQGNTMVCDGTKCTGWTANTASVLVDVSAYAIDHAFIVGTNGTILY